MVLGGFAFETLWAGAEYGAMEQEVCRGYFREWHFSSLEVRGECSVARVVATAVKVLCGNGTSKLFTRVREGGTACR